MLPAAQCLALRREHRNQRLYGRTLRGKRGRYVSAGAPGSSSCLCPAQRFAGAFDQAVGNLLGVDFVPALRDRELYLRDA